MSHSSASASAVEAAFGAYIISYLPDDQSHRDERLRVFRKQLDWWLSRTDVSITVLLSNWQNQDVEEFEPLGRLGRPRARVVRLPGQIHIHNRIEALRQLYDSQHDWGIMLDDDAILYDKAHHNSGSRIFAEMSANGTDAYRGVDVFFPINPQKIGFNPIWRKDPELYGGYHVFQRNLDLKGSMFFVRNLAKEGREPIYPPADYHEYGEDTLFAIEAVSSGCSVMQCQNIVLKEFSTKSHYAKRNEDRKPKMKAAHEAIVDRYSHLGLRMKDGSHLLDKREFVANCWKLDAKRIVTTKPS